MNANLQRLAELGPLSDSLIDFLSQVVSPESGLISSIATTPIQPGEPEVYVSACVFSPPPQLDAFDSSYKVNLPKSGSGAGLDLETSLWSTAGEAIERSTGTICTQDVLTRATAKSLGDSAVSLSSFIGFDDTQYATDGFPYYAPDDTREIDWGLCTDLLTGEEKYLPAQCIWLGYDRYQAPEEIISQNNSNGMGCGQTLLAAIGSGLNEVLERDAFLAHWFLQTPGQLISQNDPMIQSDPRIFKLLSHPGLEFAIHDISSEFDISCYTVFVSDPRVGTIACGAAANYDPKIALRKAILEALHTRSWSLDLVRRRSDDFSIQDIHDFADHVKYYTVAENFSQCQVMTGIDPLASATDYRPREPVDKFLVDERLRIQAIVKSLDAYGFRAYAYDLSQPDSREIGMHIARVVVPGLHPLTCGHTNVARDDRRLKQHANRLGLGDRFNISNIPHPFP